VRNFKGIYVKTPYRMLPAPGIPDREPADKASHIQPPVFARHGSGKHEYGGIHRKVANLNRDGE
jgi:hypothetical protein